MTQQEIDREIAAATGESLAEIRRHGFSVEREIFELELSDGRSPWVFDWDSREMRPWFAY